MPFEIPNYTLLDKLGEGAMAEVHSMLQRVRDLAIQFNNGTLSSADQTAITDEVGQLCAEINRIGADTEFNGISLLTGSASISFQIGAESGQTLSAVSYTHLTLPTNREV